MKEEIIIKIKELVNGWCCDELKESGKELLLALDTDKEQEFAEKFIKVLEWSICTMEELDQFAHSDKGKEILNNAFGGEEGYKNFLKHVEEMKEHGDEYCDCPACTKALEILNLLK